MLIDTHCHINIIVKNSFDTALSDQDFQRVTNILQKAEEKKVFKIFNVGTSLIESTNSVELAKRYKNIFAVVGIHPNDLTDSYKSDLKNLEKLVSSTNESELFTNKIIGIGECGMDFYYPNYNKVKQEEAFRFQIELALKYDLPVVVHSRNASDETLRCLELYKSDNIKGVIHCFSYDLNFAKEVINLGFVLGIGGAITYPKNNELRNTILAVGLSNIILETDAPYLPIQSMRGKQNSPEYIYDIALYLSHLYGVSVDEISNQTAQNVFKIFNKLS